jgi:membrane-bound inhibitor of C-type lysozyme
MNKQLLILVVSSILISCAETSHVIKVNKAVDNNHSKNIKYTCDRGTQLSVNFTTTNNDSNRNIAIINGFGSKAIILPNKTVASGFLYTNGKYSLRGKEKQATWSVGRMTPFHCSIGNKLIYQEDLK